ncbi:hypothetical protein [Desulfobacter curvatus]|uniref:hypothetical protein n=1 Tax=Desulfobacter curvatus TaxID=2290 RepID=UPI00036C2313|nr:hypothetical protein [Desulfobacter curvatus]
MNKEVQSPEQLHDIMEKSLVSPATPLSQNSWVTLVESLDLFFKSLQFGRVRGLVDIIDTPDHRLRDNSKYLQLIRELIQHDIMITISGCQTIETPPAGAVDQDLFQFAGDGLSEFCDFIGVRPVLYIGRTNEPEIVDFYNEIAQRADVKLPDLPVATVAPGRYQEQIENFGNIFTLEKDPGISADLINAQIHEKRLALKWCDRCGGCFSPFS